MQTENVINGIKAELNGKTLNDIKADWLRQLDEDKKVFRKECERWGSAENVLVDYSFDWWLQLHEERKIQAELDVVLTAGTNEMKDLLRHAGEDPDSAGTQHAAVVQHSHNDGGLLRQLEEKLAQDMQGQQQQQQQQQQHHHQQLAAQQRMQGQRHGQHFEMASQVHDQLADMRKDLADVVRHLNQVQQSRLKNKVQSKESQVMATLSAHLRAMQKCEAHVEQLNEQCQTVNRRLDGLIGR